MESMDDKIRREVYIERNLNPVPTALALGAIYGLGDVPNANSRERPRFKKRKPGKPGTKRSGRSR